MNKLSIVPEDCYTESYFINKNTAAHDGRLQKKSSLSIFCRVVKCVVMGGGNINEA